MQCGRKLDGNHCYSHQHQCLFVLNTKKKNTLKGKDNSSYLLVRKTLRSWRIDTMQKCRTATEKKIVEFPVVELEDTVI